jgi:hypothetical protein
MSVAGIVAATDLVGELGHSAQAQDEFLSLKSNG